MGVVYLGRDTKLDRPVAIKALPEHLAEDPDRLARFEREARTLAQLSHPNVAGIYGVEEQDGARYLVLEYVEGETLAERLDRGVLAADETIDVCTQIASGVEAAHEAGVIHRDLKPANVKITPSGQVKVLDFGLAKSSDGNTSMMSSASQIMTATSAQSPNSPTVPGVILGTAPYMSPEQARGRSVDQRTDIWSFGVILYECLIGTSPFRGETVSDSIGAILHKEPDLALLPADTPRGLRRVLQRCLRRDKDRRWQAIGDVRIELEDARNDEHTGGSAAPGAARSWPALAGAVVATAVIVAGAVWLGTRPEPPVAPEPVRFSMDFADQLDMSGMAFQTVAISPDGSTIVHSAGRAGRTHLYIRKLNESEATRIPGTQGGRSPFFSDDGQRLGFLAQGELKWLPLSGGMPLTVARFPGLHFGADWLPDGSIVYSTSQDETLSVVSSSGGTPRALTIDIEGGTIGFFRWPRVLPDGRHLLVTYMGTIDGAPGPHILVVNIESGTSRVLTRGTDARLIASGFLMYLQGESFLVSRFDVDALELVGQPRAMEMSPRADGFGSVWAAVSDNGTLVYVPGGAIRGLGRLVWVERDGRVTSLSDESRGYYTPRLSPDGSRITYWSTSDADGQGVFSYDIRQGRSFPIRYTTIEGGSYPIWVPGEQSICALVNEPGGGWTLQSARPDGSGTPQVIARTGVARLITSFDPSGAGGLGYEVNPVTNRDILLVESFDEMRPLIATPANERAPRIAPGGDWFAFVSDQSGQDEVYVSSYPDGEGRILVSVRGGTEPCWSPDGSELYFRTDDAMMAVPVTYENGSIRLGQAEELFKGRYLLDYFGNANYDVDPEGGRFLMVLTEEVEEWEKQVVLDWTTDLERMLPRVGGR